MICIEPAEYNLIETILKQAKIKFYAFGSRVTGKHRQFYDLDLCYKQPIDYDVLNTIQAELEESELPFTVDLIDYTRCSEEFQQVINTTLVEF